MENADNVSINANVIDFKLLFLSRTQDSHSEAGIA